MQEADSSFPSEIDLGNMDDAAVLEYLRRLSDEELDELVGRHAPHLPENRSSEQNLPASDPAEWLAVITDAYLESGDFNGLPVYDGFTEEQVDALVDLLEEGKIEIRTSETSLNPHIRREPGALPTEAQVDLLRAGESERYVLYPKADALEGDPRLGAWADAPYQQRLASGAAALELVYFDMDVLENYRNDPRYAFSYWDFGVSFNISDEAYLDPGEAARDKVSAAHVGFAYTTRSRPTGPVERYLVVFVKDLADMTAEHQKRWRTYEAQRDDVQPHTEWFRAQFLGEFPKGPGTFGMCLQEMEYANELGELLWGEPLFRTTERPREWGWMIRGSASAYRSFAQLADKLLSENLRGAALDAAGAASEKDGNRLGTLKRLEALLVHLGVSPDDAYAGMGVWHEIRDVRHEQAHVLAENTASRDLLVAQVAVMKRLANSLAGIRMALARQSGADAWEPRYSSETYVLL